MQNGYLMTSTPTGFSQTCRTKLPKQQTTQSLRTPCHVQMSPCPPYPTARISRAAKVTFVRHSRLQTVTESLYDLRKQIASLQTPGCSCMHMKLEHESLGNWDPGCQRRQKSCASEASDGLMLCVHLQQGHIVALLQQQHL